MGALPVERIMQKKPRGISERWWIKALLTTVACAFLGVMVVLPLAVIFTEALGQGIRTYLAALTEPDAMSALRLTLLVSLIAVPLNVAFGLAASWAIAKFDFPGKPLLITCIDLPFSVSPVISGLIYALLLGSHSLIGNWLISHGIGLLFAVPGIVLATIFVTFPFVARELIPLMQEQGSDAEEAAVMLGASGW
jgi:sulfate/thiosulfate transport system permease protein